jgi:hypothetical protein
MEESLKLSPALVPNERMQLVYNDKIEIAEHYLQLRAVEHEQRLQGLGRDEENASGILEDSLLPPCVDVPMPAMDGDLQVLAESFQALELVVDESL